MNIKQISLVGAVILQSVLCGCRSLNSPAQFSEVPDPVVHAPEKRVSLEIYCTDRTARKEDVEDVLRKIIVIAYGNGSDCATPTSMEEIVDYLLSGHRVPFPGLRPERAELITKSLEGSTLVTALAVPDIRAYYMIGEVVHPCAYSYYCVTTVDKAIEVAGGFTETADRHRVELVRADGSIEAIDYSKVIGSGAGFPYVYPGDRIVVKKKSGP